VLRKISALSAAIFAAMPMSMMLPMLDDAGTPDADAAALMLL